MSSEWVTIGVAFIGAASTLVGVLLTQRSATAREHRERVDRADARKFELVQAQQAFDAERVHALLERRVAAHERFLRACGHALDVGLNSIGSSPEARRDRSREAALALYEQLTPIRMFAGTDAVAAAEEVMQCATSMGSDETTTWDQLHMAVASYRAALRDDIGTSRQALADELVDGAATRTDTIDS